MPTAVPDTYTGLPGEAIYAGVPSPNMPGSEFGEVTVVSADGGVPHETADQTLLVRLHASGGPNLTTGRQYSAEVSGGLAYDNYTDWPISTLRGTAALGRNVFILRPSDTFGRWPSNIVREGYWMGFTGMGQPEMNLIVERRLDALMEWTDETFPYLSQTRRCLEGGSMGAWGTLTYGLRRADKFAALYPDRPKWRYANYTASSANVPNWPTGAVSHTSTTSPMLRTEDGGGKATDHMDMISYVSNTANTMPWVGWCIGRSDGFSDFRDHVDAVVALRAAKRAFAFVWNNGNHSTGSIPLQITASYPYGTFEIGKGYPLFTNHSGDQDPAVDLVGGINQGLSFRNVVESATGWSCEITSIAGARTVDVEPISQVFSASVTKKTVTIPAANTWVSVSFIN